MDCSEDLEMAAESIDPASLEEARRAIGVGCREFLNRLEVLEGGLTRVRTARDVGRFARALSMYLLASLPLRPETCPFCVQHSGGNRCRDCVYAETHGGRCDTETSAFGLLIEAVIDLAGEIHDIQEDPQAAGPYPGQETEVLKVSIERSWEATEVLMLNILEATVGDLMVAKRGYIEAILNALPTDLIDSPEVDRSLEEVRSKLKRYW